MKYNVIVSDRQKRMIVTHIRFIAQVNKEAAKEKKKELLETMEPLCLMLQRFPFLKKHIYQIQDDKVYGLIIQ